MAHYTDGHQIQRGSSVDIIERCVVFMKVSGDFEGILDYAEDEDNPDEFQSMLRKLSAVALAIIAKESKG